MSFGIMSKVLQPFIKYCLPLSSSRRYILDSFSAPIVSVYSRKNSGNKSTLAVLEGLHERPSVVQPGDLLSRRNTSQASFQTYSSPEEIFGNHERAYGSKSTWELFRALSIFTMCRFPSLADNALKIMELSRVILRKKLSDILIRNFVYRQFVAGETIDDLQRTVASLRSAGVGPMLCCPVEQDFDNLGEKFFDQNANKILDSVEKAIVLRDRHPMIQFKHTALASGDLLTAISPLCLQSIHNIGVLQKVADGMQGKDVEFKKLPGWKNFPQEYSEPLLAVLRRLGAKDKMLVEHDIVSMEDAEYIYLNPALRFLSLASMLVCNRDKARVFYTYQAYLKKTYAELDSDLNFAKANGFFLGVKLVRGAYMVQERQYAHKLGYPDPVNENFDATCKSYHACLNRLLEEVASGGGIRCILASHNEDTVCFAMRRMEELGIPKDSSSVFFGQLYGMADHVSFTLGNEGYNVFKSIPYGTIDDTLPYLARRAQENKSILVNARRERNLVLTTLKDRLLLKGRAYT